MRQGVWLGLAGILGLGAVVLGAYGAHGRFNGEPAAAALFETAHTYHIWHGLAVLALALAPGEARAGVLPTLAGIGFVLGIVLFSGSLYASALGGPAGLAPLTPVGGASFMVGWLALLLAGLGRLRS